MLRFIPFAKFDKLVRRLRKLVRYDVGTTRRDALALVLGLHGLRVTEVVRLMVGDLDVVEETLTVRTLKRGKPRRTPLGPGVFRELRRLAGKRAKTEPLFTTGPGKTVRHEHWQKFARAVTADVLGGDGVRFHALRHTLAMRLYVTTRDMQRVKARLGHRSLQSTQVYVDAYAELDDRELRKYRGVDPLPGLQSERRGSGLPRRRRTTSSGDEVRAPRQAPSAPAVPRLYPGEKTHVSLGNQSETAKIVRAKTRSSAHSQKFPVSASPVLDAERRWMSGLLEELEQRKEAVRKSG